jgi:hypothetical protein
VAYNPQSGEGEALKPPTGGNKSVSDLLFQRISGALLCQPAGPGGNIQGILGESRFDQLQLERRVNLKRKTEKRGGDSKVPEQVPQCEGSLAFKEMRRYIILDVLQRARKQSPPSKLPTSGKRSALG